MRFVKYVKIVKNIIFDFHKFSTPNKKKMSEVSICKDMILIILSFIENVKDFQNCACTCKDWFEYCKWVSKNFGYYKIFIYYGEWDALIDKGIYISRNSVLNYKVGENGCEYSNISVKPTIFVKRLNQFGKITKTLLWKRFKSENDGKTF